MKKILFILVAFLVITGTAGLFLYDWVLGETEEASGPTTATALPETTMEAGARTFEIVQEDSEARFIIYEELRGEPVDVVGATNQVAGQFRFDPNDLGRSELGVIRVNARTFVTDEERRDRATRNRILHTDEHEFITFTPTRLEGLSGAARAGEPVTFSAHGDLAIRDVVHPAEFEIVMEIAGSDRLVGEARTSVSREDYNLIIPNLAFLANVGDEVRLEFTGEFRIVDSDDESGSAESAP